MDKRDKIIEGLFELHPVERISCLMLTVIQCNIANTKKMIAAMTAIIVTLARLQVGSRRIEIVELLRTAADDIERPLLEGVQ